MHANGITDIGTRPTNYYLTRHETFGRDATERKISFFRLVTAILTLTITTLSFWTLKILTLRPDLNVWMLSIREGYTATYTDTFRLTGQVCQMH